MPRRAKGRTPPYPASDILAKAKNSAVTPGGDLVEGSGAETAAGCEGMRKIWHAALAEAKAIWRVFKSIGA
jgi:hypothetical protein